MNFSLSSGADAFGRAALVAAALALFAAGCGPSDGSKEYVEAEEAYKVRNFEKAEQGFLRSAELSPTNVDALVMLTRVRLDKGDIKEAALSIAAAAALAPDDVDVIELGAQTAWYSQDYGKAREGYLRLTKDASLSPEMRSQAFTGLGIVDLALIDQDPSSGWMRDRARVELLQALALDMRNASAHYHLGLLYRDAFHFFEAALDQFNLFAKLSEEADQRVRRVQHDVIHNLKAQINDNFAKIPGASSRDANACAKALKRGDEAWKKSQYRTARSAYAEAYKADPLSYQAAVNLAKAWEKTDQTANGRQKAYGYYRAACHLKPSGKALFIQTGDLAMKIGNYASAVDLYSRAVAASSRDITAIDCLIRALRKAGSAKAAAQYQTYRDTIPVRK